MALPRIYSGEPPRIQKMKLMFSRGPLLVYPINFSSVTIVANGTCSSFGKEFGSLFHTLLLKKRIPEFTRCILWCIAGFVTGCCNLSSGQDACLQRYCWHSQLLFSLQVKIMHFAVCSLHISKPLNNILMKLGHLKCMLTFR